jgi:hypothetical protein
MDLQTLPLESVRFHPTSGTDWNGRVFWHEGELFRAMSQPNAAFYRKLFDDGVIRSLCDQKLLVESEIAPVRLEGYAFVVKHRKIPYVSYPNEWASEMLKDASLLLVDLEIALAKLGISNHDPVPWNVLFDATQVRFVDLSGILPLADESMWVEPRTTPQWPGYHLFSITMAHPLQAMAWGRHRIARPLLMDFKGLALDDLEAMRPVYERSLKRFSGEALQWFKSYCASGVRRIAPKRGNALLQKVRNASAQGRRLTAAALPKASANGPASRWAPTPEQRLAFLAGMRRRIEEMRLPEGLPGNEEYIGGSRNRVRYYQDHHRGAVPSVESREGWTVKNRNVDQALDELKPRSLLDFCCSTGWYSTLAARKGARVIACDVDEMCVNTLYKQAKAQSLNILPLVMDFRSPSPGVGPCNRWLSPATERFRCDVVLLMAVMHHLVFSQNMTFDGIVETLDLFASRAAIVEFVPADDEMVRAIYRPRFYWYTQENFMDHLRPIFPEITVLDSFPGPRKLLVCRRRDSASASAS